MQALSSVTGLAFQGLRFAITGLTSYLIYISLFFVLSRAFGEYVALVIAYVAAAVIHFLASKYFTFLSRNHENLASEGLRFALLLCLTTVVNWTTYYASRQLLALDVSVSLFMGILMSSAISFSVMRAWVFVRR